MKIDNKNFSLDENILNKINDKMFSFYAKTGEMPKGFLLGPKEYLSVITHFQHINDFVPQEDLTKHLIRADYSFKLFGIDVYLKQNPGIDIIIPGKFIAQFALGIIDNG